MHVAPNTKFNPLLIIGTMMLYFGWLLSFPFYGPIFSVLHQGATLHVSGLVQTFVICHGGSYLVFAVLFKRESCWYHWMTMGATVSLMAHLLLVFVTNPVFWTLSMGIMGVSSSAFVLGWSALFSLSGSPKEKLGQMALIMIGANLLLLLFTVFSSWKPEFPILFLAILPLFGVIIFLLVSIENRHGMLSHYVKLPLSMPLMMALFLFVLAIYLNGGFLYQIMLPLWSANVIVVNYYPFLIYSGIIGLIYLVRKRIQRGWLIYFGIAFLGFSFIAFSLLGNSTAGYLLTIGLMESSFALLDVFLWATLASLAYIYGAPYPVYGVLLGANVFSIVLGNWVGELLGSLEENIYLTMALLSASSVLLVIMVIPWLNRFLEQKIEMSTSTMEGEITSVEEIPFQKLMADLPRGKSLTDREQEVVRLVLKGKTNKDIAQNLYISEHTVKTHIKNICNKFGVGRKKDLLHLANRE